ncbi:hypothetical protein GCM10010095_61050 [Streptomyces anthocyanicus]|uniref:hypothetical protein n=1 Tax=Streptomyces anthocyanicus TaxID=68174 RepID=UPI0019CD0F97|nr:hypothetical protein [Streptomyces anthocyanicus]GGL67929.1 hypothetical protein GCM10010095_61050 [Streptomyces anthocyanicus]
MANLVAEYGTDIETHIKALSVTIQADTPTGAPVALHALLEQLGLEHHEHPQTSRSTSGTPCPDHLGADEQKRLATRAIPALPVTGYTVNCDPDVFDEAVYQQAEREVLTSRPKPSPQRPTPTPAPPHRVR